MGESENGMLFYLSEKEKQLEKVDMADHYRSLDQRMYLAKESLINGKIETVVNALDSQIGQKMKPDCQLSIGVPAYKEGLAVKGLLENTIAGQVDADGNPINQNKVEYIVFLNCDQDSELDGNTRQGIKEFIEEHKDINVHLVETKLEHPRTQFGRNKGKIERKMGLIYKVLGDLIVKRNMESDASEQDKANHLMKTGGVDARGRSNQYVENTLKAFNEKDIVQCKSVAELPKYINEKFPSISLASHLEEGFNRIYRNSVVGLGVYRSWLYTEAGGFDKGVSIAEEVTLSSEFKRVIKRSKGIYGLGINTDIKELRVSTVNAIDNPDRFLFAHAKDRAVVNRYNNYNKDDREFRSFDFDNYIKDHEETPEVFKRRVKRELRWFINRYIGATLHGGDDSQNLDLPGKSEYDSPAVNNFVEGLEDRVAGGIVQLNVLIDEYNHKAGIKYPLEISSEIPEVDSLLNLSVDNLCNLIGEMSLNKGKKPEIINQIVLANKVLKAKNIEELISFTSGEKNNLVWEAMNLFKYGLSTEIQTWANWVYKDMCKFKIRIKGETPVLI